jgi:glyoxylase-like metal-dependent hydrolase (beta-lactamase superfamily II)
MLQENCYVVNDDTKECIIIDCGAYWEEEKTAIVDYIRDNQLVPKHLIATHAHIDHNFGNAKIYEEFGLKPEVHASDEELMSKLDWQAESIAGIHLDYKMPPVGKYLTTKDKIEFGNHIFTIIETPGHSSGSVFFYCENEHVAFSGDTLFRHSIGRTDFEGGSKFMIIQSLRIICQLPDNTRILPGHGEETTIGLELAGNPYLDR